jgi:hypothetical protein
MLVVSIVVLSILWLAYSWALNQRGVPDPNGIIDRITWSLAALPVR